MPYKRRKVFFLGSSWSPKAKKILIEGGEKEFLLFSVGGLQLLYFKLGTCINFKKTILNIMFYVILYCVAKVVYHM
jgi:hypothetical protein